MSDSYGARSVGGGRVGLLKRKAGGGERQGVLVAGLSGSPCVDAITMCCLGRSISLHLHKCVADEFAE